MIGKTSYESIKSVDLQVTYKRQSDVSRTTDVKLVLNGQKIDGYAKIDLTLNHPVIDVTVNHPSGKSRFYYKLDRKSERQAECKYFELEIENHCFIFSNDSITFFFGNS